MSRELDRFWEALLPGLICLSPMGAIAYHYAGTEIAAPNRESKRGEPRVLVSEQLIRAAVIPLARL